YCANAKIAAERAVIQPIMVIIRSTNVLNNGNTVQSKNTPAATMVAACINEETEVGPSIASGNQTCKGNCADFAIAPKKKAMPAMFSQATFLSTKIVLPSLPNSSTKSNVPKWA